MRAIAIWTLGFCLVAETCICSQRVSPGDLGRKVKLRILVDKVMQPEADWVTEEWMVKEAAEAGFNVFSPRRGHDRISEVKRVNRWCDKYGLYHMPWMRGTLRAPEGPEAKGKRLVWANGTEQPLFSPNSDEFWEWTRRYIIQYAEISSKNNSLIGVFLDYENYAPRRQANCYSLSYDTETMEKFASTEGIELPELPAAGRKDWLKEKGLHEAFSQFQIDHWRKRCRSLREAVDRFNPQFRFCIYPAPGTPFMVKAAYPEWATDNAPLILADACTYGRSSRFLPEGEAVKVNRKKLLRRMEVPESSGINFIYAGGIDPVVTGADPEFCGKNAVMISDVTDGYWVFYEGPEYEKDHSDYFKWFTWANRHISEGNFEAQYAPRKTSEDWGLDVQGRLKKKLSLALPEVTGKAFKYRPLKLRRENIVVLACKAEKQVKLRLHNLQVGDYKSFLLWDLRDPKNKKMAAGKIPHKEAGTVSFTPASDGVYLLGVSAGSCAYSVTSSNVPVGLYTESGLSLIHGAGRLYFKVPKGVKTFKIEAKGSGAETVRINVFAPGGDKTAARGETTLKEETVEIKVPVHGHSGSVWSLQITRAAEGVLEDCSIRLGPKLPPVVSLRPEQVFGAQHSR